MLGLHLFGRGRNSMTRGKLYLQLLPRKQDPGVAAMDTNQYCESALGLLLITRVLASMDIVIGE